MNYPNKNFRLSKEVIEKLKELKQRGESWDKLFKKILENYPKNNHSMHIKK